MSRINRVKWGGMKYLIETFPVGSFQCNCSILWNPDTKQAIVVDPGDEPEEILERLDHHGLWVSALWHTHAHIDHVGATQALKDECGRRNAESSRAAPVVFLHEGDKWLYDNVAVQAQMLGFRGAPDLPSDWTKITNGQTYAGMDKVRAIHTPGHTPGSCCLDVAASCEIEVARAHRVGGEDDARRVVLSGDTLFRRSIGRTDLWGGDGALILKSISSRLLSLPEDALVIPGHGPLTTIGQEKEKNPFFMDR